ncbi:MAG: hypothetical protein AAFU65_05920 [Pseudomonadota bacterium]
MRCTHSLAFAATVLLTTVASASDAPAKFTDSPRSLQNRVLFPNGGGDVSAVIRCTAIIDKKGWVEGNHCYSDHAQFVRFSDAIHIAAKGARFAPLIWNGQPEAARVHYSVHFRRDAEQEHIDTWLHHDFNVTAHDGTFIAAQMALGKASPERPACSSQMDHFVVTDIAADGAVTDVSLINTETPKNCAQQTAAWHAQASYVAAQLDGKQVDSTYVYYHRALQSFPLDPNTNLGRRQRHSIQSATYQVAEIPTLASKTP